MKRRMGLGALALVLAVGTVAAETRRPFTEKQLAQQQRMADCAVESKRLRQKGEVHRAFMQSCLKGGQVTVEVGGETASTPERSPKRQLPLEQVD